jgi:hypothetical protein
MMTHDQFKALVMQSGANGFINPGRFFETPRRTHDGLYNLVTDEHPQGIRTVDSTGAFMIGELERLDQTLHMPLAAVFWPKHIELREDVTIGDEVSSFTVSTFASGSGTGNSQAVGGGKAWIGKDSSQISGVSVDIGKVTNPLRPWGLELKYTILELESAAQAGRPIDAQKYEALKLKHQMDIDEQVFIGDTSTLDYGLVNSDLRSGPEQVTSVQALANGAQGSPSWFQKTADEILADFNTALTTVWANSAWAVVPQDVLLPTDRFGYIATAKNSQAGNISILQYIEENNLLTREGKGKLNIEPLKWCNGTGVGGTLGNTSTVNRMVVYTNDKDRVRYPMTTLSKTPVQYDSIYHKTTYFGRLGVTEVVYPETIGYFDGL